MDRLLQLRIRPSAWLRQGQWSCCGLAGLALACSGLPVWTLCVLMPLSVCALLWGDARLGYSGPVRELYREQDQWSVMLKTGEHLPVTLCGDSVVSWACTVLHLVDRQGTGHWRVVLLPDAADAESLRQLRVWLLAERGR